jgi:hypothetical protein
MLVFGYLIRFKVLGSLFFETIHPHFYLTDTERQCSHPSRRKQRLEAAGFVFLARHKPYEMCEKFHVI